MDPRYNVFSMPWLVWTSTLRFASSPICRFDMRLLKISFMLRLFGLLSLEILLNIPTLIDGGGWCLFQWSIHQRLAVLLLIPKCYTVLVFSILSVFNRSILMFNFQIHLIIYFSFNYEWSLTARSRALLHKQWSLADDFLMFVSIVLSIIPLIRENLSIISCKQRASFMPQII